MGLHLEGGALTFDVPGMLRQTVSYPFTRYNEFVHVAATVDSVARTVVLYEDGRERVRGTFEAVSWPDIANLAISKPIWHSRGRPFRGVIDDTVLWNRTLTAPEILALAKARHGVLGTLGDADGLAKWRRAGVTRALLAAGAKATDLVALRPFGWRAAGAESLPELRLVMSSQDRRHFIGAHRRSRLSGRRVQGGANPRRIHVAVDGRVQTAQLRLHGYDTDYPDAARPAYVLELEAADPRLGSSRLLLQPPESAGFLVPFVTSRLYRQFGLAAPADGLCVVRINSVLQGVYRCADYRRQGMQPGDCPDVAVGNARHLKDWHSIFRAVRPVDATRLAATRPWPLEREALLELYDAVASEFEGVMLADPQSPMSLKAMRHRLALDRARSAAYWRCAPPDASPAQRARAFIDEFMLLGGNPSPFRLVESLDLSALRLPGVTLSWESDNPALLDAAGSITRPATGGPVGVALTVRAAAAGEVCEKTFPFRVMPSAVTLPALFLYMDQTVTKVRPVDAVIEICEAGQDAPGATVTATQAGRGGVHHRGNSSYRTSRKKLLSIKTDTPHRLFGDDQRRMVKTINGQQDSTFLHNGLAFGLFRDFDGDGSPRRAPFVRPAEIFVNGRYHGLFELCTQIDETLAGGAVPGAEVPSPLVIYRHETVPPRDPVMRVSRPTTRNGSQMGPYLDLEASLAGLDTSGRVSVLEQRVEIDSVIDLQLLLNLMQNDNGTPFPYLAHDALVYRGGTNGTFFHVLWDFDRGLTRDWSWIANAMMRDLEAGSPAYRERLARRWFLLREGVLGTDAVLARLAALAVPLDGYVVWDRQRWPHPAMRPHAKDIENTRRALRQNLAHMDHFLADWRGHGGEVGALAAEETETGKIK